MTVNVTTDFVDHIHVFVAPSGHVYVQHERNDGTETDPKRAISMLVQAARSVAAAHNISLEGDA